MHYYIVILRNFQVMQKIVCSYTEQLIPVAVNMCKHLVETFAQVLEGKIALTHYYYYLFHQLFVYIYIVI